MAEQRGGLTANELTWVRAGPKLISRPSATPGIDKHLADRAREYAATPDRGRLALECLPAAYRISRQSGAADFIIEIIA
jgi:hypothetical protein